MGSLGKIGEWEGWQGKLIWLVLSPFGFIDQCLAWGIQAIEWADRRAGR